MSDIYVGGDAPGRSTHISAELVEFGENGDGIIVGIIGDSPPLRICDQN